MFGWLVFPKSTRCSSNMHQERGCVLTVKGIRFPCVSQRWFFVGLDADAGGHGCAIVMEGAIELDVGG